MVERDVMDLWRTCLSAFGGTSVSAVSDKNPDGTEAFPPEGWEEI